MMLSMIPQLVSVQRIALWWSNLQVPYGIDASALDCCSYSSARRVDLRPGWVDEANSSTPPGSKFFPGISVGVPIGSRLGPGEAWRLVL